MPLRMIHLSFEYGFPSEILRFFKYEYETPMASFPQWSQRAFRFP